MNWPGKIWAFLRKRSAPISSGVGALGFVVAILSLIVAGLQAGLLYTQRATPYRTAVYVRQLEVAGDFAGVANAQLMRLNQIVRECDSGALGGGGFVARSKEYREGLDALNDAYAETLVGFPTRDHALATDIRDGNEAIFNAAIAPSEDCTAFRTRYGNGGDALVSALSIDTGNMLARLRDRLAVDSMSSRPPVDELRKNAAAEPFVFPYSPAPEKPATSEP